MNAPSTRHHRRLLDAAEAIRFNPGKPEAAFRPRQLVQATWPHKNPGDVLAWSRRNGHVTLTVRSGWDYERGTASVFALRSP
jgi:hypothetical protein